MSYKAKPFYFVILFISIVLSLACWLHIENTKSHLKALLNSQATMHAKALANGSLDDILSKDYGDMEQWVTASASENEYAYAFIMSPKGQVIVHSDLSQVGNVIKPASIKKVVYKQTQYKSQAVTEVSYPIIIDFKPIATVHVAYFEDHNNDITKAYITSIIYWYIFLGIVLISGLYIIFVRQYITTEN